MFHDELQRTYERVPKHDIVLILGDLNAKIGKEKAYENVTGKHRMYNLILLIWSKEQLPMEWIQGIICSIYKKGERTTCSNYRPITILNIAYKIFTIILNNRLPKIVESKLSDVQSGFRPNRSTLDNMFIVRQTFEKCYEYNIDLHNMFIDYTQAFDSK